MDSPATLAQIPESYFEHRLVFAPPWIERWAAQPNPFLSALVPPLLKLGVELADFSFNSGAANLAEVVLNIALRRWSAGVRIALDSATFVTANPNWQSAPQLVELFDEVASRVSQVAGAKPATQESILSFHVTPGTADFARTTANLVRPDVVGEGDFYGISRYRRDGVLTIEKSLRYAGAAFVRLQRSFPGSTPLSDVALQLHEEEIAALRLLGVVDVP